MATTITFTDATGAVTIQSAFNAPAGRFENWIPFNRPIGEGAHALGTGQRYQFAFRTDYGASFELRGVLRTDADLLARMEAHLIGGGTVALTTGDASSNTYATCGLGPDLPFPEFDYDREMREFTVRLTLINLAASPSAMLCEYP